MNIGVFAYNFPHWKTQEGIHNLVLAGYKPKIIMEIIMEVVEKEITTPKEIPFI